MAEIYDATAWSGTLLGLFTLFAAVGALRKPGIWQTLVQEIEKSPALQLLSGGLEMLAGAILYFANPWVPSDVFACIMKALGGLMMLEALAVLGFCDLYFHFWLKNLSFMHRTWSIVTLICGLALSAAGMARFT